MHAVVVRATLHGFEKATTFLMEQRVPRIRKHRASSPRSGSGFCTSVLTFETEEAAQAAAEQIKANPPGGDAITIDRMEIGEVVERV